MNYKLNWSEAAKYGLILASVSVVINLVTAIFQLPGFLNIILNAVKLCASVYIVYYAMRRNADSWDLCTLWPVIQLRHGCLHPVSHCLHTFRAAYIHGLHTWVADRDA